MRTAAPMTTSLARTPAAASMAVVNAAAALLTAAIAWPLMQPGVPDAWTLLILAAFGVIAADGRNVTFVTLAGDRAFKKIDDQHIARRRGRG